MHRGVHSGVQISLLGLWCDPPRPHIEDPYGLSEEYFSTCFGFIDEALNRIAVQMAIL
jgi:protein-tyrosine phosphatase